MLKNVQQKKQTCQQCNQARVQLWQHRWINNNLDYSMTVMVRNQATNF